MKLSGLRVGIAILAVTLVVTLLMTVSTAPVTADDEPSVEELQDRVSQVEKLHAAVERTSRLIVGGAGIGLGLGLLIGTSVAFVLWRDSL